jgi:WD40 repeat protein
MNTQPGSRGDWVALSLIGLVGVCSVLAGQDSPAPGPQEIAALQGHTNYVRCIALSPDGQTLVSGSDDLTVKLWDIATGKVRTTLRGHNGRIEFVALTPDGGTIVSADCDGAVKLWDAGKGAEKSQLREPGKRTSLMVLCEGGQTLIVAGNDNRLETYNVATGKRTATMDYDANRCWSMAISPSGNLFSWGDREEHKRLRLFELPAGRERPLPSDGRDVAPQVFSADGKSLIVIIPSQDLIELREVATGKTRSIIRDVEEEDLGAVMLHPGGRILACAYGRGRGPIRFWDAATGRQAGEIKGHGQGIDAITFSSDGSTLAAAEGPDTTIRVWSVRHFWMAASPASETHTTAQIEALWTDLADADAAKAYQAMWRLASLSKPSMPWISQRLRPVAAADPERTAPLIAALDDDDFEVREQASRELTEIGDAAAPALRAAQTSGASPETRQRAGAILARLGREDELLPNQLRELRAIEALESAGTPEARQILERLAGGLAEAGLTRQARASLARLAPYKH